jgi:CheY-like chemotaxis protein
MPEVAARERPGKREALLVVDDNPGVQRTLEMVFGSLGYEVDVVGSGVEALPLLAVRNYVAVVCDLLMPGMRGDELFWTCREHRPEMADRFVFLTGSPDLDDDAAPLEDTGQPWLTKPCRIPELQAAVNSVRPDA